MVVDRITWQLRELAKKLPLTETWPSGPALAQAFAKVVFQSRLLADQVVPAFHSHIAILRVDGGVAQQTAARPGGFGAERLFGRSQKNCGLSRDAQDSGFIL